MKKQVDELDAGKANNVISLLGVISISSDKQGEVRSKGTLRTLGGDDSCMTLAAGIVEQGLLRAGCCEGCAPGPEGLLREGVPAS